MARTDPITTKITDMALTEVHCTKRYSSSLLSSEVTSSLKSNALETADALDESIRSSGNRMKRERSADRNKVIEMDSSSEHSPICSSTRAIANSREVN